MKTAAMRLQALFNIFILLWSVIICSLDAFFHTRLDIPQRCSVRHIIFILDESSQDPTRRNIYTEFSQDLIGWSVSSTFVTQLTLNSNNLTNPSFNVISSSDLIWKVKEMWNKRPKLRWSVPDLIRVCCGLGKKTLIVSIDLSLPMTDILHDMLLSKSEYGRIKGKTLQLKVYEISVDNSLKHRMLKTLYVTPHEGIVQHISVSFSTLEKFKISLRLLGVDVCRSPKITESLNMFSFLGNGSCTPRTCFETQERSQDKLEVTSVINAYRWKLMIFFSPIKYLKYRGTLLRKNWASSKIFCHEQGLFPLTIRNKKEAEDFSQYILVFISTNLRAHIPGVQTLAIRTGLARDKNTAAQRFSWGQGRDLLYSHWAPGEPRAIAVRKCMIWKFTRNISKGVWIDRGWYAAGCGEKNANLIICDRRVPPKDRSLKLVVRKEEAVLSSIIEKGALCEVIVDKRKKTSFVMSTSLAVASGFLYDNIFDSRNLIIQGLVQGMPLTLPLSLSQKESLKRRLMPMFHPCKDEEESQWHFRGVPLSLVCDGKKDCPKGSDEAFCVYPPCSSNEYQCSSGQCVPMEVRCDLIEDCADGTDETGCELDCLHKQCSSGLCLPKSLFLDGIDDCGDGSDEVGDPFLGESCVFICNRTQCVTREMLNDSVLNCKGPEGPLDEVLGALESINCSREGERTFRNIWAPKCILARDNFGGVIGCREYMHLSDCRNFSCPEGYVKCPDSFCIPLSYVQDGKEDCDEGEDEGKGPLLNLPSYFLCNPKKTQKIFLTSVCDGKHDCAQGEDELDCGYRCPPGFICLAGAVSVFRHNTSILFKNVSFIDSSTRFLDLSGLNVPDFFQIFLKKSFSHLLTLRLSRCNLDYISSSSCHAHKDASEDVMCEKCLEVKDFKTLKVLDLSYNKIQQITKCSYLNVMHYLEGLNLSFNLELVHISPQAFSGLIRLRALDLSNTGIKNIASGTFDRLEWLEVLSLKDTKISKIHFVFPPGILHFDVRGTKLLDIGRDVFGKVKNLRELRSSTYKLCCPSVLGSHIQRHVCRFSGDAVSSCTDLVKEISLRVILWAMTLGTLTGNIVTLFYRLNWERELLYKPYGLFVTNLCISDLIMGIYLLIVAAADVIFWDEYVLHDYSWRNSQACWTAGVLATLSSITSSMFVALITVDRFLAVSFPFGEVRFIPLTMTMSVLSTWTLGVTVASLPVMPFAGEWVIFSISGMCLGLPLNSEHLPGWQYSAVVFVGLNLFLFLFIGVGQFMIFKKLREKGKKTRKHATPGSQLRENQRMQEFAVAKQLSLVVMTNFVCWCPIISMGIVALCGRDVGPAAFRWSAVLVLPINSALNPVLYTLPALKKKWADFRDERRQRAHLARLQASSTRAQRVGRGEIRRKLLSRVWQSLAILNRTVIFKAQQGTYTARELNLLRSKVKQLIEVNF